MSRAATVFTIAGVTVLGGLLAYVAYFDYKRRNDVEFRKKLRKEKKRVDKTVSQTESAEEASNTITTAELQAALEQVRTEDVPKSAEEKEHYFMSQVSLGEQLSAQGPAFHLPAAVSFYRALRVYPSPVELIVIYQKTVPEPVFKIVMDMTNLDVTQSIEGYYENFPPKNMNVSVKTVLSVGADGKNTAKKTMIANKDFEPGDIIYKEQPLVTALDSDLEGKGTHCSQCFRHVEPGMAIPLLNDVLSSVFCSKDCQFKAKAQYHTLLFSLDPSLPEAIAPEVTPEAKALRLAAQKSYVEYLNKTGRAAPLLVAKTISRQVAAETLKVVPTPGAVPPPSDIPEADKGTYSIYDHVERLRYLEMTASEEEMELLRQVLQFALPGLEEFVTSDRHATLLGKVAYNSYGVCFSGGRDDKPQYEGRPEDAEKTRTPYGTSRQVGTGFYLVSSYLAHSCAPSARPSFSKGTAEFHLVANTSLKKGDELTVSYVDIASHAGESAIETRRRRRMELARGWRFACSCDKCNSEGIMLANGVDADMPAQKDESLVEASVQRIDERTAEE